jgi:cytochrome o ubiquinol oxidase subunit III
VGEERVFIGLFHPCAVGLLWMIVMLFQVGFKGITSFTQRRLDSLRLFWQFLNVIWIFIFAIVYMMGAAA